MRQQIVISLINRRAGTILLLFILSVSLNWLERRSAQASSHTRLAKSSLSTAREALAAAHTSTVWTVTNTNDSGAGSLRQAISDAVSGDTISFNIPSNAPGCVGGACTITLTSGELLIEKNLNIFGPGAKLLTVSGNNQSRVFYIRGFSNTINLSGLTIANGNTTSFGGGVLVQAATLNITGCAITNNIATGLGGGGLFASGVLNMTSCTVSGNTAREGGGVHLYAAQSATLTNSTISGNSATRGAGIFQYDMVASNPLTLVNCTVANNQGEGLYMWSLKNVPTAQLRNTLFAGNTPNFRRRGAGTLTSLGHNLDSDGTSGFTHGANGNIVGSVSNPIDARLASLGDYTGPTQTHALLTGSPAIDAGTGTGAPTNDQRGLPRPQNGNCDNVAAVDIGAFEAAVSFVTNTNNSGAGSLRQAIFDSQVLGGGTVCFNIPASDPNFQAGTQHWRIRPTSQLPPFTKPIGIDGLSQPGANGTSWPPTLKIELDGTNTTTAHPALTLSGGHSLVRGLVINQFQFGGILLESANNRVEGNFIGTDVLGTTDRGNGSGVQVSGAAASNNIIGGPTVGARNLISGNELAGVLVQSGATGNQVLGNYIGTDVMGAAALGNALFGVALFDGAANNTVGGTTPGAGNRIAFNGLSGVQVTEPASVGNRILGNSIFAHANVGINLNSNGVTPNDAGDPDTGPNRLQNFPVLTGASSIGVIAGTLNSTANRPFRIEFFANTACDPAGNGEGESFLGFINVTTDAGGNVSFSTSAFSLPADKRVVTATATDLVTGDTSEFSACRVAVDNCDASLSKPDASFTANGGTDSLTVTIMAGCPWTATSNNAWITINSPVSPMNGTGTVSYSVASNGSTTARNGTITVAGQTFTVWQGAQFNDVPPTHPLYEFIGKISARGVTQGCGGGNFCPEAIATREQMAVLLSRALGVFTPVTPATQRFADVPPSNPYYAFIEEIAVRQITLGCGGGNYCPTANITREQMAAFLIRALHEPGYVPPTPTMQRFADVPPSSPFYAHIEELATRGITLGCGGDNYCPTANVTRAQMAAFLVRAFGL